MTQKEFNQFVDTMEQEIRSKDSVYRGFVNTNKSMLSCTYLKQTKLQKGRYMSTRIHVSEWIKDYMFEVRVTIHADGENGFQLCFYGLENDLFQFQGIYLQIMAGAVLSRLRAAANEIRALI